MQEPVYTADQLDDAAKLFFSHVTGGQLMAGANALRKVEELEAELAAARAKITELQANQRTPGTVEVCSLCLVTPIDECGGVDENGIKRPCPVKVKP